MTTSVTGLIVLDDMLVQTFNATHAPGLTATLEMTNANDRKTRLLTGEDWLANTKHCFGPSPWNWGGIPDRIDARLESGDWTLPGFDDSGWEKAVRVDGEQWGRMHARGIPLLRETEITSLTLLEHSRTPVNATGTGPLGEVLPLEIRAGESIVIDVGQFVQAYTVLDFDADEGSQIEAKHAQTYHMNGRQPGGVMSNVNRYTARAGRQTHMSTDTFGFKYLLIGVVSGRMTLHDVKVVNRLYPFDVVGRFASSDDLLDRLWRYSVNTMLVCSEDAYVDCASRERVEWLADAVKVGHPVAAAVFAGPGKKEQPYYGDPRLLEALLRHVGQSMHSDGRVKAHHPSDRWDIHGFIEDYSCLWVHALRHYCDATGDARAYAEAAKDLREAINTELWDEGSGAFHGAVKAGAQTPPTVHAAIMGLYYAVAPLGRDAQAVLAGRHRDACFDDALAAGQLDEGHEYRSRVDPCRQGNLQQYALQQSSAGWNARLDPAIQRAESPRQTGWRADDLRLWRADDGPVRQRPHIQPTAPQRTGSHRRSGRRVRPALQAIPGVQGHLLQHVACHHSLVRFARLGL